jgi:decaprenyl-phosphate phosphoribosyltransferase
MCAAASAAYCVNDVWDREQDRKHPLKQKRPVAAGTVSIPSATTLGVILCVLALYGAWRTDVALFYVIFDYLILQILYSLVLKKYPIVDILALALSFVLRVIVGVAATSIYPSTWILIFTGLLALLLAAGKRYAELSRAAGEKGETRGVLAEYPLPYLGSLLSSVGAVAIVSYLLWCGEMVMENRFLPGLIFPSAFFVAFGILRYQLLVFRDAFPEDPTIGLVKDAPIMGSGFLYVCYLAWLIYLNIGV